MKHILLVSIALTISLGICFTGCQHPGGRGSGADLAKHFANPPDSAKPWVFMWWYGKITKEDITQHEEELKSKGLGGFLLFDHGGMPGVTYISDPWRELFRHTVSLAARLNLKMGVNVSAGWPSGGPWITPEKSSWMTVSSKTTIRGPVKFHAALTEPTGKGTLYNEIAVQAFPISDEKPAAVPVVTLSDHMDKLANLLDGNYMTLWNSGSDGKQWIKVDFGKSHLVDWVWVDVAGHVIIESSKDGNTFLPLATFDIPEYNTVYSALPTTSSRLFRILVPNNARVRDFAIGSRSEVERLVRMASKRALTNPLGITGTSQYSQMQMVRADLVSLPGDRPLQMNGMIDLSGNVSDDGVLDWDVPPGTWKVVRIGRTTTGIAAGGGLLPDYLSGSASELNFEKGMKPLISDAGNSAGKTFQYFHEDNVEIGGIYSWTPELLIEFQKRRGYDPSPYLAAMAGEIIGSIEITDRFLSDVRRTIADCVADGHYGKWAELAHAGGVKVRAEAGGQHHPRLLSNDGLMNQGRMDVPMAEFWENEYWKENQFSPANHHVVRTPGWDEAAQSVNAKQAASAGHLYGKRIVAAEAFTSLGPRSHWRIAPNDLRLYANIAFCEGINAMTIHGSATSGPENGKPGTVFAAGIHFNHNVTWWNQSEAFISYLSRCQYILQQGLFVADVLYYSGDEIPCYVPPKNVDPSLGFGYDYDVCNTEILLTRLSVKDGRIVLPDGLSYRVLVLPERPVLPLSVVKKIEELVTAGATVIGPKPRRTPGLSGYPQSETQLAEIADRLWGPEMVVGQSARPILRRNIGKGFVIKGMSIREVLNQNGIEPDFAFKTKADNALMDFIHRSCDDSEIYFVINRRASELLADCTFRVTGKQPEIWDPVTGKKRDLTGFTIQDIGTTVPLEFEPYGCMFIVFRKPAKGSTSVSIASSDLKSSLESNFPKQSLLKEITGPWKVQFETQWSYPNDGLTGAQLNGSMVFDSLVDWSQRPEQAVRYFSGTAVYRQVFDMQEPLSGKRILLDLGIVKETARVKLNGKDLGVIWCPPWQVDVTGAVRTGENSLVIEVVNLWPNRLIGDARLPAGQGRTKTNIHTGPGQPLMTSGLLGPVQIRTVDITK